jgi:hypothetical protein
MRIHSKNLKKGLFLKRVQACTKQLRKQLKSTQVNTLVPNIYIFSYKFKLTGRGGFLVPLNRPIDPNILTGKKCNWKK